MESLSFKSDTENICIVEKLIDDLSTKYSINSDIYGKLLLAVVEGVNNAIIHGNKLDKSKTVTIEYFLSDKNLDFYIEDQGSGFEPDKIPDPTKPENLEKTHGRGIFLMNHLADEVEFIGNGSKVKLSFNL